MISIAGIIASIVSTLSDMKTWLSTPKKARNPGRASHVFKNKM